MPNIPNNDIRTQVNKVEELINSKIEEMKNRKAELQEHINRITGNGTLAELQKTLLEEMEIINIQLVALGELTLSSSSNPLSALDDVYEKMLEIYERIEANDMKDNDLNTLRIMQDRKASYEHFLTEAGFNPEDYIPTELADYLARY